MNPPDNGYESLSLLLREEEAAHELLMEELKRQEDYLKRGEVDLLARSVEKIDGHRKALVDLRLRVRALLGHLCPPVAAGRGDSLETLLSELPQPYREGALAQARATGRLKGLIERINNRNKALIEETLLIFRELTRLITDDPLNSPGYAPVERKRAVSAVPFVLSREV